MTLEEEKGKGASGGRSAEVPGKAAHTDQAPASKLKDKRRRRGKAPIERTWWSRSRQARLKTARPRTRSRDAVRVGATILKCWAAAALLHYLLNETPFVLVTVPAFVLCAWFEINGTALRLAARLLGYPIPDDGTAVALVVQIALSQFLVLCATACLVLVIAMIGGGAGTILGPTAEGGLVVGAAMGTMAAIGFVWYLRVPLVVLSDYFRVRMSVAFAIMIVQSVSACVIWVVAVVFPLVFFEDWAEWVRQILLEVQRWSAQTSPQ